MSTIHLDELAQMKQRELDRLRAELAAEQEKTAVSLTVGGGLEVFGSMEALHRVQKYILLDSSHPVEREDVRRSLARALQKAETELAAERASRERIADALRLLSDQCGEYQRAIVDDRENHETVCKLASSEIDTLRAELAAERERLEVLRLEYDGRLSLADADLDDAYAALEVYKRPITNPEIIELGKAILPHIESEKTENIGAIAYDAAMAMRRIFNARLDALAAIDKVLKETGDE